MGGCRDAWGYISRWAGQSLRFDAGTQQHDLQWRDTVSLHVEAQDNDAFERQNQRLTAGGN